MDGLSGELRFYGELAAWWPLISPVEEYVQDAAQIAVLLDTAAVPVREVLELGSGGGHLAVHLNRRFAMTLADLSDDMLAVSRRLNPECLHVRGDMRTLRLGRRFDAVVIHDAIAYMTTEDDLRRAVETAFVHCRAGGVAVFVPDETAETFRPETNHGGTDAADGRGVRYLEWSWDADPRDTWIETAYAFVVRDGAGGVRVVHETHRTGLFARATWLRILRAVGFDAGSVPEANAEGRVPRQFFVARRREGRHR